MSLNPTITRFARAQRRARRSDDMGQIPCYLPRMENGRNRGLEDKAFLWLVIAISLAFLWIIAPLYAPIMWAIIIVILFVSIHRRILARWQRPNLAAFATLGLVLLIVVLPLTLLTLSLAREGAHVYEKIQSGDLDVGAQFQKIFESMPGWATDWLNRFGLTSFSDLKIKLAEGISKTSKAIALQAIDIGQSTFGFLLNLFVMLYLLFFLFRDGDSLLRQIKKSVPLDPETTTAFIERFDVVIRATVKGNMIVALIQGGLGGVIFWILGIQGPVLWGAIMALFSLLPAVGPALIWLPVAIYLIATGAIGRGIILILFGAFVIGLIDNLLRPILVGKDTKIPDYLILISTLGGIAVFGINGFVIGPLIAAMFISAWEIYTKNRARAV
jgi:predicted PurR-regulated permease PerM